MPNITPAKFTFDQIKSAWDQYHEQWGFKFIKDGKRMFTSDKPPLEDKIYKLERCRAKDAMQFPDYLLKHSGKTK